jgi:type VI secretion system secreted protein Hcp
MKRVWIASAVILASTGLGLAAQGNSGKNNNTKPQSAIAVNVNGLGCSTTAGTDAFSALAWSWGATNTGDLSSGGGGGAGKVNAGDVNVSKPFDACSPLLFGAVATGKHFQSLTLTQSNSDGTATTLQLTDVIVSSWQAGGSVASQAASENVSFAFAKVCLTDGPSGTKFCYDLKANKTF